MRISDWSSDVCSSDLLAALIADGRFREDLFYRLNGIEPRLPPLSARPRDILPLARHFLAGGKRLAEDAERAPLRHAWPGNVRELRTKIGRATGWARGCQYAYTPGGAGPSQNITTTQNPWPRKPLKFKH